MSCHSAPCSVPQPCPAILAPPRHPSFSCSSLFCCQVHASPPNQNAKYHYKLEEFGCIKSPRRPVFRQVRLPVSSRTTTAGDLGPAKYPFELSLPQAPSSTTTQVPRERLYLYRRLRNREDRLAPLRDDETDKSEDASTTPNHVRRPSPKTRVTQTSSSTTVA